jgi:hypothetical protein
VLHSVNNSWYVKLLDGTRGEFLSVTSPSTHFGHPKVDYNHLASCSNSLHEKDLEDIKRYTELHFTSSQSALLLSKDGRNFLSRQLAWLSKKAILPSSQLTADASSADKLLEYLDSQDDITWITLMDKRGINSGLVVTTNKGRPKGATSKLTRTEKMLEDTAMLRKFSGDAIRKELQLTDSQSILLAVAWISDEERRLVSMFPEVLFMDVTSQTNNEKRGLFMVAGKDSHGRGFTATRIFLPSEQKWVFRWIFSHALPFLFSQSVLKRNCVVITDGDSNMYEALNEQTYQGGLWQGTHHFLCQWHLLNCGWNKEVKPHIPTKDDKLKDIGKKNWMSNFLLN